MSLPQNKQHPAAFDREEAELCVLGSIAAGNATPDELGLRAEHFSESLRPLFEAMQILIAEGKPIDGVLIKRRLGADASAELLDTTDSLELLGKPKFTAQYFAGELRQHLAAQSAQVILERLAERNHSGKLTLDDLHGELGKVSATIESALSRKATLTRLADVETEEIRWLWRDRMALGKLTLIAGDPGLGKSMLSIDMAARVSKGDPWPDGTPCPQGSAILFSAEDDVADTIKPRLLAAGADTSNIYTLTTPAQRDARTGQTVFAPFSLQRDRPTLEAALEELGDVRLIVVDPVSAYLDGVQSHNNAEVRGVLAPLSDLAAKHGAAVLAVTHLNKGAGSAMYRATGSLAFAAAARTYYAVIRDRDDRERRLVLPVKCNIAPDTKGMAFTVRQAHPLPQPSLVWLDTNVEQDADEALGPGDEEVGGREERKEAADWLKAQLADGPVDAKTLQEQAKRDGLAWRTVRRAKEELGIPAGKRGMTGGWQWSLP